VNLPNAGRCGDSLKVDFAKDMGAFGQIPEHFKNKIKFTKMNKNKKKINQEINFVVFIYKKIGN